jgi:hypothetical protein
VLMDTIVNKENVVIATMKKFIKYLIRWQLSTPVLALCVQFIPAGTLWTTVIANLIGGCIFFWIDKWFIWE